MNLEDTKLIETIKNAGNKNRELNKEVNKINEQFFDLQEKRLKLIAKLAKDALKYEDIFKYNDEEEGYELFIDEYGDKKKGFLLYNEILKTSYHGTVSRNTGYDRKEFEIYLTQQGEYIMLEHEKSISYFEDIRDNYSKSFCKNQDLNQLNEEQIKEIIDTIIDGLEENLSDLEDTKVQQLEKLEKLRALELD